MSCKKKSKNLCDEEKMTPVCDGNCGKQPTVAKVEKCKEMTPPCPLCCQQEEKKGCGKPNCNNKKQQQPCCNETTDIIGNIKENNETKIGTNSPLCDCCECQLMKKKDNDGC